MTCQDNQQQLQSRSPFEFERAISIAEIRSALDPKTLARKLFLKDVHFQQTWNPYDLFLDPMPRILCRPTGEGKTTELNCLSYLFSAFDIGSKAEKQRLAVAFDRHWCRRPREALFEFVKSKLGVSRGQSLAEVLGNARHDFTFVSFDNIENLHADALAWLVGSIHAIEESGRGAELRAYCAISGSLGLGEVSRDITSMYYTGEQLYRIRDLTAADMKDVSRLVREMLGVALTAECATRLLGITNGDKRATHLLLHLAFSERVRSTEHVSSAELGADSIDKALESYLLFTVRRDTRMQRSMSELGRSRDGLAAIRRLLSRGMIPWDSISPASRKTLYNEAIVAVQGGRAVFRNHLVERVLGEALGRTRKSVQFLRSYLGRGPILTARLRKQRASLVRRLKKLTFSDNVIWLYYGEVLEEQAGKLRVYFVNLDGQEFEATIKAADLGVRLPATSGFLRFSVWHRHGPKEEYYIYDLPNG